MIRCLRNSNVHFARPAAFAAGDTFVLIHLKLQKGNAVKPCVKRTQGANPFAEGAIEQYAQDDYSRKHTAFPCKQRAEGGADARAGEGERNGTLQHPLRTKIFAEEGVSHADHVYHKRRQKKNHNNQNEIFQIAKTTEFFG